MPPKAIAVHSELEGPLDRAVRALKGVSWGKARAWIAAGKVSVAGVVVTDGTARVPAGAEVAIDEHARRLRLAELDDAQVVALDTQLIVVSKPPGISTVPYDQEETDTLDARVRAWLERSRHVPRGSRPGLGIVHRLDKETSGLLVFTRTWLAKQALSTQFRQHSVHRLYFAIAHGAVPSRTFRSFLVVNRGDGLRGSARGSTKPAQAREAVTHVEAIESLEGATLVACRLETGRTHQIRIHLSEAGFPLLGERVYTRHRKAALLAAPRLMLHAAELGFLHPTTERQVAWDSPIPPDMQAVLESLRRR